MLYDLRFLWPFLWAGFNSWCFTPACLWLAGVRLLNCQVSQDVINLLKLFTPRRMRDTLQANVKCWTPVLIGCWRSIVTGGLFPAPDVRIFPRSFSPFCTSSAFTSFLTFASMTGPSLRSRLRPLLKVTPPPFTLLTEEWFIVGSFAVLSVLTLCYMIIRATGNNYDNTAWVRL